jgi:NADH-ubiquinone oxidoreductase chain 1
LIIPLKFESVFFHFSVVYILAILRLNVYPLLLRGWASRNKYSILGSLRRVAQTISYEISLALVVIVIMILVSSIRYDFFLKSKNYFLILLICPILFLLWFISSLAETNRTPFDFSEGERELVSGFNTEYGAGGFAIIFIAEYGSIYFLRLLTALIFFPLRHYGLIFIFATVMVFI